MRVPTVGFGHENCSISLMLSLLINPIGASVDGLGS